MMRATPKQDLVRTQTATYVRESRGGDFGDIRNFIFNVTSVPPIIDHAYHSSVQAFVVPHIRQLQPLCLEEFILNVYI